MNRETQLARLLESVSRWKRRPPREPLPRPAKDRLLADLYDPALDWPDTYPDGDD